HGSTIVPERPPLGAGTGDALRAATATSGRDEPRAIVPGPDDRGLSEAPWPERVPPRMAVIVATAAFAAAVLALLPVADVLKGLTTGGVLYMLAVGHVVTFRVRGSVSLAHGGLAMIGGYAAYTGSVHFGSLLLGVVIAVAVPGVLGALVDLAVLRPLHRAGSVVCALVTWGILILLQEAIALLWGRTVVSVPLPSFLAGTIQVSGAAIAPHGLLLIALSVIVAAVVTIWFGTRGQPTALNASGTDTGPIVVGCASALAGLAGAMWATNAWLAPEQG